MKQIIWLIFALFMVFSCAERNKSDSSDQIATGLLFILNSCPGVSQVSSIGATSRTAYVFTGCTTTNVNGFTSENISISGGVAGSSANSKMASIGTFGTEKVNIEVTFTLNTPGGYLDVLGLGVASGAGISAPGFRISESNIKYFASGGSATAIGTGSTPQTPLNTQKTYCLEFHKENGAHLFGWSKSCAEVTNRTSYDFDQENIITSTSGNNIGFVLNGATLKSIIVSTGAIGTAGSLVSP